MDITILSAMLDHVSAATTLDIHAHITCDMLSEAAAKIDRGMGNEAAKDLAETVQVPIAKGAKRYEMIQKTQGMKETAPPVSLDCQAVSLMV